MYKWYSGLKTGNKISLLGVFVAIVIAAVNLEKKEIKNEGNHETVQSTIGNNSSNFSNIDGNISINQ